MKNLILGGITLASLLACAPKNDDVKTLYRESILGDHAGDRILSCLAVNQDNKGLDYYFYVHLSSEKKEKLSEKTSFFSEAKMVIFKEQTEKDSAQRALISTIDTQVKVESLIVTDADEQKLDATKYTVIDSKDQKVLFSLMDMEGGLHPSQVDPEISGSSDKYHLTCKKLK